MLVTAHDKKVAHYENPSVRLDSTEITTVVVVYRTSTLKADNRRRIRYARIDATRYTVLGKHLATWNAPSEENRAKLCRRSTLPAAGKQRKLFSKLTLFAAKAKRPRKLDAKHDERGLSSRPSIAQALGL